jgi:hypothetical protein
MSLHLSAISLRENKSNICKSFASVYDGVMIRGEGGGIDTHNPEKLNNKK